MAQKPDNIVLEAIKNGDKVVFSNVYKNYFSMLFSYLLNFTSDKVVIENIIQDTFLKIWHKRTEITINTSLKSYLHRSVYNNFISNYRKEVSRRDKLMEYYKEAVYSAAIKDDDYQNERIDKLRKCIEMLPKKCRAIFKSNKLGGFKYSQVAEEFNVSLKTVEGHITRAYKLLKACMSES